MANNLPKRDLVVTRIIDAPLELVWKAWTDPQYVMRWWGPEFYTSPTCKIHLAKAAATSFACTPPKIRAAGYVYHRRLQENRADATLEFTQSLADKDGHRITPDKIGMPPDFPGGPH